MMRHEQLATQLAAQYRNLMPLDVAGNVIDILASVMRALEIEHVDHSSLWAVADRLRELGDEPAEH